MSDPAVREATSLIQRYTVGEYVPWDAACEAAGVLEDAIADRDRTIATLTYERDRDFERAEAAEQQVATLRETLETEGCKCDKCRDCLAATGYEAMREALEKIGALDEATSLIQRYTVGEPVPWDEVCKAAGFLEAALADRDTSPAPLSPPPRTVRNERHRDRTIATLREKAQRVADAYTAEAEDWNDGEFALWQKDDLVVAIVNLRTFLATTEERAE